MWVCTAAAILAAGTELVEQEIARRAEARMIATHNTLALQSYDSMRLQNEQMLLLRHDMAKHLNVLRQMTDEGQRTAYLDELIGQNEKIRPVVQSGNQMLDILLNGKLSQAISAGGAGRASAMPRPRKPAPLRRGALFGGGQSHG